LLCHDEVLRARIAANAAEVFKRTATPDLIGEEWLRILTPLHRGDLSEKGSSPTDLGLIGVKDGQYDWPTTRQKGGYRGFPRELQE